MNTNYNVNDTIFSQWALLSYKRYFSKNYNLCIKITVAANTRNKKKFNVNKLF